jgi:hypothetical protein
VMIPQKTE